MMTGSRMPSHYDPVRICKGAMDVAIGVDSEARGFTRRRKYAQPGRPRETSLDAAMLIACCNRHPERAQQFRRFETKQEESK